MEPLIALVATSATLAIIGAAGVRSLRPLANPLRFGLAVMFAMTGTAHFVGSATSSSGWSRPPCPTRRSS